MNQKNLSLLEEPTISDEFLYDFIMSCPHPANLKDAKTGCYILGNQATAEICGLETKEQLVGFTVREIDSLIKARWGNTYAVAVEDLDQQVKAMQRCMKDDKRAILERNGFVRIQNMIKIPMHGYQNQVHSILTYSCDVTKNENLFSIFDLYKKFHASKRVAVENFLKYLKIDGYFLQNMTESEVRILISMQYNNSHKEVARQLGIKPKTVEIHVGNIRNKLKDACLLSKLLSKLRT